MKRVQLPLLITAIAFAVPAGGQLNPVGSFISYRYSAAFISTIGSPLGHTELVIFPPGGTALRLPIRSASGPFAYSADGHALYGQCSPFRLGDQAQIALCKIDLKTMTTTPVSGSMGLYVSNFAVADNDGRIIAAGLIRHDRDVRGLFEITTPRAEIRPVFLQADRSAKSSWGHLSLSPDGKKAVATRNGQVELIDIAHSTTETLGDKFFIAAWSPDGKWLAGVEKGERGNTILMDAKTLVRRRTLGPSELDWSPDSHYLLGIKPCDSYSGTLEAVNIETAERTIIESSQCQVNQATTGWIGNDVYLK